MKPGYKTTEFWVSLIGTIAGLVVTNTSPASTPAKVAGLALTILSILGYTTSRTLVKQSANAISQATATPVVATPTVPSVVTPPTVNPGVPTTQ